MSGETEQTTEEALVPRCPSCRHFARHHESYPYLDGVLCKTRKDRAWCDCSLTVDQVTVALITEARRDATARAAQVVRDASEQDTSRGGLVRHWMLRLADEIEAGAGYIHEESPRNRDGLDGPQ